MVNDKIDIVITYVDMNDDNWWDQFLSEKNKQWDNKLNPHSVSKCRFRDLGTLKFVLRSIDKYAPFVNNVFLVVQMDSQVPDWINRDTVKVILHEEFMPKEVLPTYSSCAIEMYLHLIPGLSEKFIYFNDDMILWNPCRKEDFFIGDCCVNSLYKYIPEAYTPPTIPGSIINPDNIKTYNPHKMYRYINGNSTDGLYDLLKISKHNGYTTQHNPSAFLKSVNEELYGKISDIIKEKSYQFRCDDSLTQYMYITYSVITNRCINVRNLSTTNILRWTKEFDKFQPTMKYLTSGIKQIYINDHIIEDFTEDIKISIDNVFTTLEMRFEKKCKYENIVSFND